MNSGRYPDIVVNEAVKRIREGAHPKDVADELREKYGFEKLHWKTVKRWCEKYPMGKQPKSWPPKFKDGVRELVKEEASIWPPTLKESCRKGDHSFLYDPTLRNFVPIVLKDDGVNEHGLPMRVEIRNCPICKQEIRRRGLAMFLY